MAVQTFATSVGTVAVPILANQPFSNPGTAPIVVSNLATNPVFIGGPNVTAASGVQIVAGTSLPINTLSGNDLWAVAATGNNNVVVGVF